METAHSSPFIKKFEAELLSLLIEMREVHIFFMKRRKRGPHRWDEFSVCLGHLGISSRLISTSAWMLGLKAESEDSFQGNEPIEEMPTPVLFFERLESELRNGRKLPNHVMDLEKRSASLFRRAASLDSEMRRSP